LFVIYVVVQNRTLEFSLLFNHTIEHIIVYMLVSKQVIKPAVNAFQTVQVI